MSQWEVPDSEEDEEGDRIIVASKQSAPPIKAVEVLHNLSQNSDSAVECSKAENVVKSKSQLIEQSVALSQSLSVSDKPGRVTRQNVDCASHEVSAQVQPTLISTSLQMTDLPLVADQEPSIVEGSACALTGAPSRMFRPRTAFQKAPYTEDMRQHRAMFRLRGIKPVAIPNLSHIHVDDVDFVAPLSPEHRSSLALGSEVEEAERTHIRLEQREERAHRKSIRQEERAKKWRFKNPDRMIGRPKKLRKLKHKSGPLEFVDEFQFPESLGMEYSSTTSSRTSDESDSQTDTSQDLPSLALGSSMHEPLASQADHSESQAYSAAARLSPASNESQSSCERAEQEKARLIKNLKKSVRGVLPPSYFTLQAKAMVERDAQAINKGQCVNYPTSNRFETQKTGKGIAIRRLGVQKQAIIIQGNAASEDDDEESRTEDLIDRMLPRQSSNPVSASHKLQRSRKRAKAGRSSKKMHRPAEVFVEDILGSHSKNRPSQPLFLRVAARQSRKSPRGTQFHNKDLAYSRFDNAELPENNDILSVMTNWKRGNLPFRARRNAKFTDAPRSHTKKHILQTQNGSSFKSRDFVGLPQQRSIDSMIKNGEFVTNAQGATGKQTSFGKRNSGPAFFLADHEDDETEQLVSDLKLRDKTTIAIEQAKKDAGSSRRGLNTVLSFPGLQARTFQNQVEHETGRLVHASKKRTVSRIKFIKRAPSTRQHVLSDINNIFGEEHPMEKVSEWITRTKPCPILDPNSHRHPMRMSNKKGTTPNRTSQQTTIVDFLPKPASSIDTQAELGFVNVPVNATFGIQPLHKDTWFNHRSFVGQGIIEDVAKGTLHQVKDFHESLRLSILGEWQVASAVTFETLDKAFVRLKILLEQFRKMENQTVVEGQANEMHKDHPRRKLTKVSGEL